MAFAKRMLGLLDGIDAEIEVLGDDNLADCADEIEALCVVEERLQVTRDRLHGLLEGRPGAVVVGVVDSEDHPVFRAVMAKAHTRRERATKLRRRLLRVV